MGDSPSLSLLERARRYVEKMPGAVSGEGGHNATFHVACVLLQGFDLPMGDAASVLAEYNARCAPPWSERELEHKLRQADKMPGLDTREGMKGRGCLAKDEGGMQKDEGGGGSWGHSAAPTLPPARVEFSPERLRAFALRWRGYVDTAWLHDRSAVEPYRVMRGWLSADEFLSAVFREGEKVVIFTNQRSQGQAIWPLQGLPEGGDEGVWYLAQPVDGKAHVNPREKANGDGSPKMSRRSEEAVTDWRHLVLESDEADARDWMGALVQLPLRVVAIYTSGGRSIHALVRVDAKSKGDWDNVVKQIRPALVTLGADPRAMSAVRLTRLPGCWRGVKAEGRMQKEEGAPRLQKLLYLNPAPEAVGICTLGRRWDVLGSVEKLVTAMLGSTPAAVRECEQWETVERCFAALRWFESSARAREMLRELKMWTDEIVEGVA